VAYFLPPRPQGSLHLPKAPPRARLPSRDLCRVDVARVALIVSSSSTPTAGCSTSKLRSACPKSDLQARPIYHHKRDSIEAHLSIVFAALAVSRHIESQTGWSIRKFVRTARRYRTIQIRSGTQILTAEDPLPPDVRNPLALIN
jgi:hypothetical protein